MPVISGCAKRPGGEPNSVRSRASGNPGAAGSEPEALGPRFRGDERKTMRALSAGPAHRHIGAMTEPLVVVIPHSLGKDEAARRIKDGVARAKTEFAYLIRIDNDVWDGDRLSFAASALTQHAHGCHRRLRGRCAAGGDVALAPGALRPRGAARGRAARAVDVGEEISPVVRRPERKPPGIARLTATSPVVLDNSRRADAYCRSNYPRKTGSRRCPSRFATRASGGVTLRVIKPPCGWLLSTATNSVR